MKKKTKEFWKNKVIKFDEKSRNFLDKWRFTHPIYEKCLLSLEGYIYRLGNYKLIPSFKRDLLKMLDRYIPDWKEKDPKYIKKLEKDMVKAHICHRMAADEYFLYGFEHQDYWQRWEWLSDKERLDLMYRHYGGKVFAELTDKSFFYNLAKDYFHRDVCFIDEDHKEESFLQFTKSHPRFIIKPLEGMLGANTFVTEIDSEEKAKKAYKNLIEKGKWIAEELIKQHKETEAWNPSSVNTFRIPSFRTKEGVNILQPFFRTGRKGSVVDNAGHGGIFAVFDPETGIITTDGVDEYGGRYETHPDSHLKFKGWKIPHWEELKALVAEVHHSLPAHHRYVGFDFALTNEGKWVLVEGNWGQMVGQMAELKGIRNKFVEYIS